MPQTKTRALITGITGMVGSHLADYLLSNTDWDIYGACRWRSPLDNVSHLLDRANKKDRVYFSYADLNDAISLDNLILEVKPDYVFHLAAQSNPKTSFISPLETLSTNIIGTCALLEIIKKHCPKAKVHVCASSEVYGKVPLHSTPINEECGFHPASPYSISKVGADMLGRFYAEAYGMHVITTRMFSHTGPRRGDVFAESSFAKQIAMIEAGQIEATIKVGNLKSVRTYTDVRDAVRAYYLLLTENPIPGEYYNIGGTFSCTIGEVLDYLISLSHKKSEIKIEIDPDRLRPIDVDLQVPDASKFTNHSGWHPQIKFEQTMSDLLEYWRLQVSSGNKFLSR
jgi:GDP-mannose 4,6-dehydratase